MIPQLDIPASRWEFSQTHVAHASDLFPQSKPARPALAERLLDIRVSMRQSSALPERLVACDQLLAEYHSITQQVEAFIVDARQEMIDKLREQRVSLWNQCRSAEDRSKAATLEIGRLNGLLNHVVQALSTARAKLQDASAKNFDTRFPNARELEDWGARRGAAQNEFDIAEMRHRDVVREFSFAEVSKHDSEIELRGLVEQMSAVDNELAALQKEI